LIYINLLRWAASVALWNFVPQNTTHHVPFVSRTTQSYFTIYVLHQNRPLTINTAYKPLGATLRTDTLPFLIPVDWLVLYGSQHHLLLFLHPGSFAGQSIQVISHTSALLLHPPVLSTNAMLP